MKELYSVSVPKIRKKHLLTAHFNADVLDENTIAILRPYENDFVILDVNSLTSCNFPIRDPNEHKFSSRDGTMPKHSFAVDRHGEIAIFDPITSQIKVFNCKGSQLKGIKSSFEIESIDFLDKNFFVAYGGHQNHMLHLMDMDGSVKSSRLPVHPNERQRGLDESSGRRIFAASESKLYVLAASGAGIVDAWEPHLRQLERRFVVNSRRIMPLFGSSALAGDSCATATESCLSLTFPYFPTQFASITANCGRGVIAVCGMGTHVWLLDADLKPEKCLALPQLGKEPMSVLHSYFKPQVFTVLRMASSWIVCTRAGEILSLADSELREVNPWDCFNSIHPYPESGYRKEADIIYLPEIEEEELRKHASFWRSIRNGSFEYLLQLDETGRVVNAEIPDRRLFVKDLERLNESREILRILALLRFRPERLNGKAVASKLRVLIQIDGWSASLCDAAGDRLRAFDMEMPTAGADRA